MELLGYHETAFSLHAASRYRRDAACLSLMEQNWNIPTRNAICG